MQFFLHGMNSVKLLCPWNYSQAHSKRWSLQKYEKSWRKLAYFLFFYYFLGIKNKL
jgi:hypothetical protein